MLWGVHISWLYRGPAGDALISRWLILVQLANLFGVSCIALLQETLESLRKNATYQRRLFDQAVKLVCPGGIIVYST